MGSQTVRLRKLGKIDIDVDDPNVQALLLDHLESLATIDEDAIQKRLFKDLIRSYVTLERRVDSLLKNTLPASVAETIKYQGRYPPTTFACTILFTDFSGFTHICEKVSRDAMVKTLDTLFAAFDDLIDGHGGTKVKTIGDAYMAVFGAPMPFPAMPAFFVIGERRVSPRARRRTHGQFHRYVRQS